MSKQSPCPRDPSCHSCHVCEPEKYPALARWRREGIRAAESPASVEQVLAFERELGRRVGAAVRITKTDTDLGTGTYQVVVSHGQTVSKPFIFTGSTILTPTFAAPINAGGPSKGQVAEPTPTPDPYAKDLAALKTASATPESTFEDAWKADRLAALDAEHRRLDAHLDAHLDARLDAHPTPRTAEGRISYPPPNPYEAGIKALREKEAR